MHVNLVARRDSIILPDKLLVEFAAECLEQNLQPREDVPWLVVTHPVCTVGVPSQSCCVLGVHTRDMFSQPIPSSTPISTDTEHCVKVAPVLDVAWWRGLSCRCDC